MQTQHGNCTISLDQSIVFITLVGSFNEDGIAPCIEKAKELIGTLEGKPFCTLLDLREYGGSTPEAFEIQNDYNAWLNSQNLIAKAVVMETELIVKIARSQEDSLKEQEGITKDFDNLVDAHVWLCTKMQAKGFHC